MGEHIHPGATLPTDAERAQARAEHLDAIADCFELLPDGPALPLIEISWTRLGRRIARVPNIGNRGALLDEARAIRDRLAELIEDAETGGELTPDESSRQDDIEAGFDLRDLDTEVPR